jgi:hypothetical protein
MSTYIRNAQYFVVNWVADPHQLNADPDPSVHFNAYPDPTPVRLMRIGVWIHIRLMQFCDHCSTDLPRLHFEPLRRH